MAGPDLSDPLASIAGRVRVTPGTTVVLLGPDIKEELGVTQILIEHELRFVLDLADRVAVLDGGVIQQVGTPMELYEAPANLFVAGFLGTANIVEGKIVANGSAVAYETARGERIGLPSSVKLPLSGHLVFRPQSVALSEVDPLTAMNHATFQGRIVHREFLGATMRYGISFGAREILADMPFRAGDRQHVTGDMVWASVPASALLWLET